jgi:hypothetical protein
LNQRIRLRVPLVCNPPYLSKKFENPVVDATYPTAPSLKSKSHKIGDKDPKTVACRLKNDNLRNYQNDDTNDEN